MLEGRRCLHVLEVLGCAFLVVLVDKVLGRVYCRCL
jgi:hypothetical protein